MITGPAAIAVMVIFAVTGGSFAVRAALSGSATQRLGDLSHLLMAVIMILMPSGLSMRVPALLQLVIFTVLALWYAALALFRPAAGEDYAGSHHTGRTRLIYHTLMMLAMAFMAVIMAPLPGSHQAAGSGMSAHDAMPGMSHDHSAAAMPGPGSHPWAEPVMIMAGVGFAVAAVWYLGRFVLGFRSPSGEWAGRLIRHATDALMASGMALSFLVVKV